MRVSTTWSSFEPLCKRKRGVAIVALSKPWVSAIMGCQGVDETSGQLGSLCYQLVVKQLPVLDLVRKRSLITRLSSIICITNNANVL